MWIIMHHIALISKGCEGYWSQSEDDLLAWIAIGLILSSLLRPYCIHAPSTNREQEREVANTFAFVTAMFLLPVAESHVSAATQSLLRQIRELWHRPFPAACYVPCFVRVTLVWICMLAAIRVGMLPLLKRLSLVLASHSLTHCWCRYAATMLEEDFSS